MTRSSLFCPIISWILLSLVGRTLSQTCWYPDGLTRSQADVPCDPNADVSACCGPNAFCLSNGLCSVDGVVSRGSCTDKNWGDGCATACADVGTDTGVVLQSCDPSQNTFVCNLFNDTCDGSSFTLDGANTIVLRPDQVETGSVQQRHVNPTSTFTAAPSQPASTQGFSTVELIGACVGIGVPLLAALVATIFIVLSQRRRIKGLKAETRLSKEDSGFSSPSYAHSTLLQPPASAYGRFEYKPLTHARPQGHFQELVVTELDSGMEPQELPSAKPRR